MKGTAPGHLETSILEGMGPEQLFEKPPRASRAISFRSDNISEPVFFFSQIERSFAAFHYALDRVPDIVNVDRAYPSNSATRLVSGRPVVAPGNEFCVAVHDQIRVVACEDELAFLFRLPDPLDDFQHYGVI